MTKQDKNGGPAFPQLSVDACQRDGHGDPIESFTTSAGGMSLLDWFAGQALAGEIASMDDSPLPMASGETRGEALDRDAQRRAEWCYRQARAMLAVRARPPSPSGTDIGPHNDYGPDLVLNVTDLPARKAQAIADAHNSTIADLKRQLDEATAKIAKLEADVRSYEITIKRIDEEAAKDAAKIADLTRERDEAREAKLDAESTLSAWFDLAKKTEEQLEPVLMDAIRGYLRTSRVGGMPQAESDAVEAVLADFVRLYAGKLLVPFIRGVALTTEAAGRVHPDDEAVDRFAAAMKIKLARKRAEGRGGWESKEECSNEHLSVLLRGHIEKGDPVDVGNLAMMIHQRGEAIATRAAPETGGVSDAMVEAALVEYHRDDANPKAATWDVWVVHQPKMAEVRRKLMRRTLEAAIASTAPDWRPIDTAPRDGTSILAVVRGRHHDTGKLFMPDIVEWINGRWWREDWSDDAGISYHPTHWQPLPAPPATPTQGGQ